MSKIKERAELYFDENALRYKEDHYQRDSLHPKWVRHHAILELIQEFLPSREKIILDIGCGPGFLASDLSLLGYKGIGADTSKEMIDIAKNQFKKINNGDWSFEIGDAEKTQFEDNKFDCVVASGVLEYMDEDMKMLAEMHRILKPGGYLIINVSNKLGYATSLNILTNTVKKLPYVMRLFSIIRKRILGREYDSDNLGFAPRKHFVFKFKRILAESNFAVQKNISHHYSLFPAPISTLTHSILRKVDHWLDFLGRTPLRVFAASNLICAQKSDEA